jgi:hypothetical protein
LFGVLQLQSIAFQPLRFEFEQPFGILNLVVRLLGGFVPFALNKEPLPSTLLEHTPVINGTTLASMPVRLILGIL